MPEPVASNTSPRRPVSALLRECLTRRDAEFAELDEAFLAHEDHVMELESFSAKVTSGEANLRSQVIAL